MNQPTITRLRLYAPWLLVLASATLAIAAYWQALDFPFVSDDLVYIAANQNLGNLPATELWRLLTKPYNDFQEFLPLRELSYWIDISLSGQNPAGFRLHNILLYLLCLPLVYALTSRLWQRFRPHDATDAPWAAAAVTSLFALHPAHVEAVVWIAGRKDVLSGMLSLLALWLALKAHDDGRLAAPRAIATLLVLLAAIYSKATAIAVAVAVALLWLMSWRDAPATNRRRALLLWPAACLLLVAATAATFAAISTQKVSAYWGHEIITRTLAIVGWMTRLSLSPESRHFYYPVLEQPWLPLMAACGAATLLAVCAGGFSLLRKRSLEGLALSAFLLFCLPSLQIVPYKPPSLISDRFLFLVVWPVILLMVSIAWRLKRGPRAILLLAIASAWGFQSIARTPDWANDNLLTTADYRAYPSFYVPAALTGMYIQMGNDQYREAAETAGNISQPEVREVLTRLVHGDYLRRAEAASGNPPDAAMNALLETGRLLEQPPAQAQWDPPLLNIWERIGKLMADEWERLAEKYPDNHAVRYNAGMYDMRIHFYLNATRHLQAALQSAQLPDRLRGPALLNLGIALMNTGRLDEAARQLNNALLRPHPDRLAHCALAELHRRAGRITESAHAAAQCHNDVNTTSHGVRK